MVAFEAKILKSDSHGAAMIGWAYINVPHAIAQQLKPDYKQPYRVRGEIDGCTFSGLSLMPKGRGDYILAINGNMRKALGKGVGDLLFLRLEEDKDFIIEVPEDLEICFLNDEADLMERFMALTKSHRNYFIKYINEAKTELTRTKRIAMTVEAMAMGLDFGAMIRLDKTRRQNN
ncbi:YdeI/OmpD-associated family protein [Parapedobacter deserti]|uniref:YdeI/OmpD-associated family protein n=1 Tax=Parapedobacter deserti TaxID=1912957 RepID=A0ABV7JFZ1_9SPHI